MSAHSPFRQMHVRHLSLGSLTQFGDQLFADPPVRCDMHNEMFNSAARASKNGLNLAKGAL